MEPFAIVGFAFKLAQEAVDDSSLWEVLEKRKNLMTEWPKNRANIDTYYDQGSKNTATIHARGAHFCKDDLTAFDAPFFSINPHEAAVMDPQQRWALQTVYHAFENAGIPIESAKGSRTAVFGASSDDYSRMLTKDVDSAPRLALTGTDASVLVGKISWYFNLVGPCLHINTACSSSLIALDYACKSMQSGDASAAVVLGSNFMFNPDAATLLSNLNFLSPDGLCYTFDSRANGYARGEGILAMIVKPMADALRDGNVIRAVVRATGANQDGRTASLTQPSAEAQEQLIHHVYRKAGLGLQDTRYIEAHGTGTPTGDPIEAKAIGRAFRTSRSSQEPLYIGSIKGNIGHVEAGSGIAGTIKAILALEKGVIPPQALFEDMNPAIDAEFYNIRVPTACIPWPTSGLRRASVNSFSLGGSNAHIILDDALHYLHSRGLTGYHNCTVLPDDPAATAINGTTYSSSEHPVQQQSTTTNDTVFETNSSQTRMLSGFSPLLLVWSGADSGAIDRLTEVYEPYLQNKVGKSRRKLNQLAYTLSNRRSRLAWRSFTLISADEIASGDGSMSLPTVKPVRSSNDAPVIAFVFTGQGAQYADMGLGLLQYKIFVDTLHRIDNVFASFGSMWSLLDVMGDEKKINHPRFSQPLCTALQIALVELLKTVCIAPSTVLGHSSGEIAAAYAIGALSFESACKVAYYRGVVAEKLKESVASAPGAMMSVNLPRDEVQRYLYKVGGERMLDSVHLACINSLSNCTLSGDEEAINVLKNRLDQDEIFAQKINTGVSYHSPAMKVVASEYAELLGQLQSSTTLERASMISTVTGLLVTKLSTLATAQYWVDNLLSPVLFADALQSLESRESLGVGFDRITDILEVGPHSSLRRPIEDTLQVVLSDLDTRTNGKSAKTAAVVRYHSVLQRSKPSSVTFLELLGTLFCIGHPVSIEAGNGHQGDNCPPPLVDCPQYPFDLSRKYWHEPRIDKEMRFRPYAKGVMLGKRSHDWNNLRPSFRNWLSLDAMPWLEDHVISNKAICPGTGMLVMALEGVKHLIESNTKVTASITAFLIPEAHFLRPIPIPKDPKTPIETSLSLRPRQEAYDKEVSWFETSIFAYDGSSWTECFQATIQVQYEQRITQVDGGRERQAETERYLKLQHNAATSCDKLIDYKAFYKSLRDHGMAYGPSFSILRDIRWDGQHTSQARIAHDLMLDAGDSSPVHPAPLDAMMHVNLVRMSKGGSDSTVTYVPRSVYGLWLSTKNWKQRNGSVRATSKIYPTAAPGLEGSMFVSDEEDTLLLSAERVVMACVSLDENPQDSQGPNLIYKIERKPLLSQLKGPEMQSLCAPRVIPLTEIEQEWSDRVETALRHSAEDALYELSSSKFDTSTLPDHLQIFMQALSRRYGEGINHDKEEIRQELAKCVEYSPGWDLYAEAGRHLESLLRDEADPLELLTSSKVANSSYPLLFGKVADVRLRNFLDLVSHEKPSLRILEIGSGTGGLTASVLAILQDLEKCTGSTHFGEYIYTDISPAFFEQAQTNFAYFIDRMGFQKLDIEKPPETQGFELGSYDIVLAGSVLHATSQLAMSMSNVRKLVKPGGYFLTAEITRTNLARALVGFGSLPGWWLSTEDWRKDGPLVPEEIWGKLMKEAGFSGIEASWEDGEGVCLMITAAVETGIRAEMLSGQPAIRNHGSLILIVDTNKPDSQQTLATKLLQEQEQETIIVPLDQVHDTTWQENDVVIMLVEVGRSFLLEISEQEFEVLRTLIQKTQNLLWVTLPNPSAQVEMMDPRLHMTLGFLRSMRYEEPTKEIVSLMAGHRPLITPDNADFYIRKVLQLCFKDQSTSRENEFFIEGGFLSVERLIYAAAQDDDRRSRIYPKLQQDQILNQDPPTVLSVGTPGMLDTLRLAETQRPENLDPEAVEIACRAWPLSFRDVMIALDRYGDSSDTSGMGWEVSGVVSRVGSSVSEFQPGDRVCGATPSSMRTFVQVPVDMVFKIPDGISFARSIAALNPLLTAYHGLINLARLKKTDTILIHAAAGSTGQLAVCVAQRVGARIFATVGFNDKKQLLIDEFGIPAQNIFYSRDTSFQKGVMRETGGRGVDVVLNSLSGDKLKASWACIAPFGRFIEIGKADIGDNSSLPMAHFAKNVTFAAVDLVHMAAGDTQGVKDLTHACMAMLYDTNVGQYPKPLNLFPVTEAEKAFRFIQSGKNTGRTVITLDPDDKVPKYITKRSTWRFSSQATYVIVGGLGGIGRSLIAWMVEKGARYFITPSRSGVKSQAVADFVAQLKQTGISIVTSRCDASSSKQLADLLQGCSDMPPIRGCINAAMALQDAMFYNMTHSQWEISIQSKVASSWNLHQQLPTDLDFFILLSSAASIYGAIGQSNYSAACTAQDSIAHHRSSMGNKAISINLGLIRDVGAMVEHEGFLVSADKIRDAKAVYERDILAVMDYYCDPSILASKEAHTQVLVGGVTPSDTNADTVLPPHIDGRPFYSGFPRATKQGQQRSQHKETSNMTVLLYQQAPSLVDRAAVALGALIDKLAHALCVASDEIDPRNPLSDYGVDSLMAVELRHWFRRDFKADVAVFDIVGNNISINNVADLIAQAPEKLS